MPDTFAPDTKTFPASLEPIQQLNLTYTRSIRLPADHDNLAFKLAMGMKLMRLGLGPRAIAAIVRQLASEVLDRGARWRRVALAPMINFQFFRRLYRTYQPAFACFHTNHVAHLQHTYWKAMQPERFRPVETTEQEQKTFGGAIEYGYISADRLLASSARPWWTTIPLWRSRRVWVRSRIFQIWRAASRSSRSVRFPSCWRF